MRTKHTECSSSSSSSSSSKRNRRQNITTSQRKKSRQLKRCSSHFTAKQTECEDMECSMVVILFYVANTQWKLRQSTVPLNRFNGSWISRVKLKADGAFVFCCFSSSPMSAYICVTFAIDITFRLVCSLILRPKYRFLLHTFFRRLHASFISKIVIINL